MNYTVKMSEEAENNLKAVIEYLSLIHISEPTRRS